ncbi:MAG: hypothetical protein H7247_14295, partial [Polaromonas sp.]|nr:hypothetical protein [Gemmatimonadaceae bacterium]
MMLALALAFQLAGAMPAVDSLAHTGPLVVKDAARSSSIPLVAAPGGPLLRAELLRPIVPLTVSHLTANRWVLIVNGTAIQVEEGLHFAKVGDQTYQLATAPEVRKGALFVPLQLVAEIIPRIVTNLIWDPARFELRAFSSGQTFATREAAATPPRAPTTRRSGPPGGEPRVERTPVVVARNIPGGPLRQRRLVVVDAGHGGPDGG